MLVGVPKSALEPSSEWAPAESGLCVGHPLHAGPNENRNKPPLPKYVVRGRKVGMVKDEALFQVALNVCDVVGKRSVDCLSVFRWVKNLRIEIPIPKLLLEE